MKLLLAFDPMASDCGLLSLTHSLLEAAAVPLPQMPGVVFQAGHTRK